MKVTDPDPLVLDVQPLHQSDVVGGDSRRAMVGVASEGLNATKGHHHAAGRVAGIGAHCDFRNDVKASCDSSCDQDTNVLAHMYADQGVVYQNQGIVERASHMI